MRILVCVKQVMEMEGMIRIDPSGARVCTDRSTTYRMNRFDEYALEEALIIASSPLTIHAITVGPERSALVLRRAMGMGADHGIHLLTREDAHPTGFQTASWIAAYARQAGYDLIFTGAISEDEMQGQVGPMIAALLSIPWATSVIHEAIRETWDQIYIEREMEGGYRQTMELALPALLSVQTGINRPRYPSLSKMLRAKTQDLESIKTWEVEGPEEREQMIRLDHPKRQRAGVILGGPPEEKARQFLEIIRSKALIH